ncbi:MAG: phosphate/phosphite/phosphonate ABC transporter substrate-binding protein [Woeseiaceae bacterium]|nr:phosphate/phosphite/phosphonate ABC transporter substrate-binding protein [Woeseiaceae bacterium]
MVRHPLLTLLALFSLASCQNDRQLAPETLVVSVLPDRSTDEPSSRFDPLMDYLEATTGQSMQLVLAEDYASLLQSFINGDVHLAFLGSVTFVSAEEAVNAEPLVMRDIDVSFRSCYVARSDDSRRVIDDFKGSAFSFGSELSTSGHLMPRYFMQRSGVAPEDFFSSVDHARTHFETAQKVIDSSVAIGVMNCFILEEALGSDRIPADGIRVVAKTPGYANYVWTIQENISDDLKKALVDAYLALDNSNAEHAAILRSLRASVFLPAGRADFEDIRRAVLALGDDQT